MAATICSPTMASDMIWRFSVLHVEWYINNKLSNKYKATTKGANRRLALHAAVQEMDRKSLEEEFQALY
ncbi:hypothetical protein ZWY2020_008546 [Hordeum vulgare]|nr:hypothetical protein ZWY2020_008546 [Hordeum vulgare]